MSTEVRKTSDPLPGAPAPARVGRSPAVVLVGVAAFAVASVVAGAATPGYSARDEAVSALAARDAPWAAVMIAGFLLLAVGLAAAAWSLARLLPVRAGRAAAVLLAVVAGLMATAGLARQDCSDRRPACVDFGEAAGASAGYWVHQYASLLAFVLLVFALFLLARAVRRTGAAPGLVLPARLAGWLGLLLTVALVVAPPPVPAAYGVVQRVFLLVVLGWPVLLTFALARRAGGRRS